MANLEEKTIMLNKILESVVLIGKPSNMVWTGFPNSKYINEFMIEDSFTRNSIKTKIIRLEDNTKRIRQFDISIDEKKKIIGEINTIILELINFFSKGNYNGNVFAVYLIKTGEDILENNPQEINNINREARQEFLEFSKKVNQEEPLIALSKYSKNDGKATVKLIATKAQENKLVFPNNKEKLKKCVRLITKKKNPSNEDITQFLQEIGLVILVSDSLNFTKNEQLSIRIYQAIFYNFLIYKGLSENEIKEIEPESLFKTVTEKYGYELELISVHQKLQAQSILDNIEFIDLEKLFLIYLARGFNLIEKTKVNLYSQIDSQIKSEKENDQSGKIVEIIDDGQYFNLIVRLKHNMENLINSRVISPNAKISNIEVNEDEYIDLNYNDIKEKLKNFCGNVYLSPETEEIVIFQIYENLEQCWTEPELFKKLTFSEEEYLYFSVTDFSNLKILYEEGKIDKTFIIKALQKLFIGDILDIKNFVSSKFGWHEDYIEAIQSSRKMPEFSEFYTELKRENLITEEDLKLGFDKGIIEIETIDELDYDEEKMQSLVSDEEIIEAYKEYINCLLEYKTSNTEEAKKKLEEVKLNKNRKLVFYRRFKLEKLNEKEKVANAEEIIINYYSDIDLSNDENILEALREMYKDRLVDFESIKNTDEVFLKSLLIDRMLKRGELTLQDTSLLRESIGFEEIKNIVDEALLDDTIDENQKFVLVMNMFHKNTEEDEIARREFLNRFRFENNTMDKRNSKNSKDNYDDLHADKISDELSNKGRKIYTEYIYPDYAKWLLFYGIDKEAFVKKYANGYVEFYSPKFNKRIIEKYYDVDFHSHKIKSLAYGVSTFVITDEKYRMNEKILISNLKDGTEVINESILRTIVPRNDRVRHNTKSIDRNWMRSLVTKLGIDLKLDTRYTKKELQELNNTIASLENVYKER